MPCYVGEQGVPLVFNERSTTVTAVEEYMYKYEDHQREVMLFLHHKLVYDLNLTAKIRYKIPFYFGRSWICYLNPIKKSGVELAFLRGSELSNSQGLLNDKGRKRVWGIEIKNLEQLSNGVIDDIIHEAILLDETSSYSKSLKK